MDISGKNLNSSLSLRFILIGIIALIMLIPTASISQLVHERHGLYKTVLSDIAAQWGKPQIISGPILVVPIVEKHIIKEKIKNDAGEEKTISKDVYKNKNVLVLPKILNKNIRMDEHYRYRNIYKSLVYTTQVEISGEFKLPNIAGMSDNLHKIRYAKAFMLVGLSDTKAINQVSELKFNRQAMSFEPGVRIEVGGISSGFHSPVKISSNTDNYKFNFKFTANGSSSLRFSAFGEVSTIKAKSSWQHPSFQGAILPNKHEISAEGFSAEWVIPSLARNFPQSWIQANSAKYNLHSLLTGVDLYEPVFLYSMIERAVKYAILFIAITFLTFLIFEMVQGSRLHYIQYALIGLSLAMFFLSLLSLSEHIAFIYAYIIASAITVVSISLYTFFATKKTGSSLLILVLLSALYVILYSLLQLEDYALLMGTALLLAVLLVLMWLTRNLKAEVS